jgi:hypothetical protein
MATLFREMTAETALFKCGYRGCLATPHPVSLPPFARGEGRIFARRDFAPLELPLISFAAPTITSLDL